MWWQVLQVMTFMSAGVCLLEKCWADFFYIIVVLYPPCPPGPSRRLHSELFLTSPRTFETSAESKSGRGQARCYTGRYVTVQDGSFIVFSPLTLSGRGTIEIDLRIPLVTWCKCYIQSQSGPNTTAHFSAAS
ncbi:hypothetical protein BJX65DRAFT_281692 [Aspergillus insuetus]